MDQIELPDTAPDRAAALRRRAAAPLRPSKIQAPCDIGLFSDDATQLELMNAHETPSIR
jgi:hypothetical protein